MQSRLLSVASGSTSLENDVQLIAAAVIIFEHYFYIFDRQRYLSDEQKSIPSFNIALERYIASPQAAAVREAVQVAVHTCQGNSFARKVKLLFGASQKELAKKIVEITLEHRLPRP
ncbi:hypothetical protein BDR04DRAFT_1096825 [Suillus decipiens]|nr:hypothetical protein BDR04DRAFT_1096825 [Suillus decipiens]